MYAHASKLLGQSVISLQSGEVVAWVNQPVLEIGNLEMIALSCKSPHQKGQLMLMARDIRQFATDCVIVDSEDELTNPTEIVRLKSSLKHPYSPLDKLVVADTGRKLGVVGDYTINLETNRVQKLYVRKPLFHAWLGSNLIIDRTQIIDITPHRITVRDSTVSSPILAPDTFPGTTP